MFVFVPFVLGLYSNAIDFSILSITYSKGMRSLFRFKIDENEFLFHIFWHFNWRWCKKTPEVQPVPEPIPTTQAHMIELKEQLSEAVKVDDLKPTLSEGRMRPSGVRHNFTIPKPEIKQPRLQGNRRKKPRS
jgi:hypothetical protein